MAQGPGGPGEGEHFCLGRVWKASWKRRCLVWKEVVVVRKEGGGYKVDRGQQPAGLERRASGPPEGSWPARPPVLPGMPGSAFLTALDPRHLDAEVTSVTCRPDHAT